MEIPKLYKAAGIRAARIWARCGSPRFPEREDCIAEAYLAIAGAGRLSPGEAVNMAGYRVLDLVRKELGKERRDARRPTRLTLGSDGFGVWMWLPLASGDSRYRIARRTYHERKLAIRSRSVYHCSEPRRTSPGAEVEKKRRNIMRIVIPEELGLETDREREAYRLGFRAAIAESVAKAGATKSDKKSAAARANGAKGGRPKIGEGKAFSAPAKDLSIRLSDLGEEGRRAR